MNEVVVDIKNAAGNQAIQIPENLKINDSKVYIKKVGNGLYIIPYHQPWQGMLDSLDQFTDDFMQDRNQLSQQSRESFD